MGNGVQFGLPSAMHTAVTMTLDADENLAMRAVRNAAASKSSTVPPRVKAVVTVSM